MCCLQQGEASFFFLLGISMYSAGRVIWFRMCKLILRFAKIVANLRLFILPQQQIRNSLIFIANAIAAGKKAYPQCGFATICDVFAEVPIFDIYIYIYIYSRENYERYKAINVEVKRWGSEFRKVE